MKEKRVVFVNPPKSCNICDRDFGGVMYDARVPGIGSWANLCQDCFNRLRRELGIGQGQKYVLEHGTFVKTG